MGTQVAVALSGLQPGCHLWLGMQVMPCLCETNGTPFPAPRLNSTAIQWIAVSDAGTVRTTFCLCQLIPTYIIVDPPYVTPQQQPPYYSITPTSTGPGGGDGVYGPNPGDYFFITVAGPGIADPPPLFAKFVVTT